VSLSVRFDVAKAVREAQQAFESFGLDRFPRAVQYALTGTVIDGANRWRRSVDTTFDHPNRATRDAVRYVVDKDLLNKVTTVGEASAAVFVLPLQSTWLKYAFGDSNQTRLPGDVGVEAYFADQTLLKIPNPGAISYTGLGRPGAGDKVPGRDAKNIARMAARGYQRNIGTPGMTAGSARWGVFEVRPGDKALSGYTWQPGIWARPPRVVASVGRKRTARAIKAGRMSAPTTEFTRRDGTEVSVPKVVNNDVPRLLLLSTPKAEMKPIATPSWQRAMQEAAETMPDRLAQEFTDRLEHMARKGR
jgi:hypothetical protein